MTKAAEATAKPNTSTNPSQTLVITVKPTLAQTTSMTDSNIQSSDNKMKLKSIKLSAVKCKRNTTKITGIISVAGETVKIKLEAKPIRKQQSKVRNSHLR